jgi:FkbM family methyltransferase
MIGWLKQQLAARAWRRLGLSWRMKSGITVEIRNRPDFWIFCDIWVNREYDDAINLALDRMPDDKPLTVVDLGANVGMFALRLFDLAFEREVSAERISLLMIEASRSCCDEIERRLSKQPVPRSAYRLIRGAVGERSGSTFLDESGESIANVVGASGTPVEYIDLTKHVGGEIDLLKIDIEGSEERFLPSYSDVVARTRSLIIEIHSRQCNAARCEEALAVFPNRRTVLSRPDQSVELCWR